MNPLFTGVLAVVLVALVAGCGGQPSATQPSGVGESTAETSDSAEPTTDAAISQPTTADASGAPNKAAAGGLSGEDFIARADSLSGETITLGRCSLMTEPSPEGDFACRVIDDSDTDLKDPDGLPVDVFFTESDLSPEASAWLAEHCPDTFCIVQITGQLSVSPETFFLELSDVSFAEAGAPQ